MKFAVKSATKHAPRLGVLRDIVGKPDIKIETPAAILHTQGGQIPHVTHEVFKLVSRDAQILQIPLVSMHMYKETMQYYEGTISEFIGCKDSLTCLTVNDPSSLTKQGHHVKDKIPIWTKHGKILYDSETYMNIVESFKPDMYYLLSDGDTNKSSAHKRISKSVETTLQFINKCLERHKNSTVLKNAFVMAPIAGGYCLKSRKKCVEGLLKHNDNLQGYLIDGLHNNGPEVEFLPYEEIKPVVEVVISNIPAEKLRTIQGCFNPVTILKLVKLGIDIFDTSYCRILTERSAAMTFAIDTLEDRNEYEINLRQSKYADDFQPLMYSCQCVACSSYSRGYIHHLVSVSELLGPVLIMIHNVHHFLRFFKKIRECIEKNTLDEFEYRVSEQYKHHQVKVMSSSDNSVLRDSSVRAAGDVD